MFSDATVETRDGRYVLRYERRLDHPIEKVWAALTEPEEIVGWLAQAELDLSEGGQIVLRWLNYDEQGNQAVLHGTITRLDPPRLIEYESDAQGVLRWELSEDGEGCLLAFTNITPAPEDQVTKNLAGWHIHLDHLAEALDGRPVDWPRWWEEHHPKWQVHHERYERAFGSSGVGI
jgi:uncharacterized protein YndB with AHSA1/START domain